MNNGNEATTVILPSKNARLVSLRKRFSAAAALIQPVVRANYASGREYVDAVEGNALLRKNVQTLALQLVKLDRSNRLYWERQYDRYDSCYTQG
jgi:hypothetical protein